LLYQLARSFACQGSVNSADGYLFPYAGRDRKRVARLRVVLHRDELAAYDIHVLGWRRASAENLNFNAFLLIRNVDAMPSQIVVRTSAAQQYAPNPGQPTGRQRHVREPR
jgi:hypothetical protein